MEAPDVGAAVGFTRLQGTIVATCAALVFTRVFGMSVVLPDFRTFASTLTVSATLAGIALGAYGLTLAAMQLPFGVLSDRWGRRPVLVLASALFVAGSVAAAVAPSIETLIAARLLQGTGAVSSVAMAFVGQSVPAKSRTLAMALVGIPAGGGFMVGLIAGPLLSPVVGVPGLFWLTAALGLVATVPVLLLPPPVPGLGEVSSDRPVGARVVQPPDPPIVPMQGRRRSVLMLAWSGFAANLALLTVMFHVRDAGTSILVPLLVVALIVMLVVSRTADRRAWHLGPIAVALPVMAAGAAAFILGTQGWAVMGGLAFFSAHASLSAMLPSQVSRVAGASGGKGHGVQNVVAYPGSFLGGLVAGWAQDAGMPWLAFVIVAAVCLATAAGVARHHQSDTAPPRGSCGRDRTVP